MSSYNYYVILNNINTLSMKIRDDLGRMARKEIILLLVGRKKKKKKGQHDTLIIYFVLLGTHLQSIQKHYTSII